MSDQEYVLVGRKPCGCLETVGVDSDYVRAQFVTEWIDRGLSVSRMNAEEWEASKSTFLRCQHPASPLVRKTGTR